MGEGEGECPGGRSRSLWPREGKKQVKRGQENETQQSTIAKEWVASESAQDWARLRPPLAKLDLRPYLFVAKDRKDYFGAITLLGQIAAIAEKLLGPKIAVQKEEPSLRQLALPEAGSSLRQSAQASLWPRTPSKRAQRVPTAWKFLSAHSPSFKTAYSTFSESVAGLIRLGAWVCTGWNSAIQRAFFLRALPEDAGSLDDDGKQRAAGNRRGTIANKVRWGTVMWHFKFLWWCGRRNPAYSHMAGAERRGRRLSARPATVSSSNCSRSSNASSFTSGGRHEEIFECTQ